MTLYRDRAAFYRAALLVGLVRGEEVIAWADEVIAADAPAPAAFIDIATTAPSDLTVLRHRLLMATDEHESPAVVGSLLGVVNRDLASGRRTLPDTMTVLKQLRAFIRVDRALNEQLKTLGVDVALAAPGSPQRADAEQRVRGWLHQFDGTARTFVGPRTDS